MGVERRGTRSHRMAPWANGGNCVCCGPQSRRGVAEVITPLSHASRLAFLMGASNTSVPRLAEACVEAMRDLPQEVCMRIFDMSCRHACAFRTDVLLALVEGSMDGAALPFAPLQARSKTNSLEMIPSKPLCADTHPPAASDLRSVEKRVVRHSSRRESRVEARAHIAHSMSLMCLQPANMSSVHIGFAPPCAVSLDVCLAIQGPFCVRIGTQR